MTGSAADETLAVVARRIGEEVAGLHAEDVDASSRFPTETIDACREAGLLRALVSVEDGGLGASLDEVADAITELGRWCSSSGMILAMHTIQVACLVRHGGSEELATFRKRVAAEGLLLASATTEVGIGGDVRSSTCAVEARDDGFHLRKQAPVISYGEYADAILATARRTPESAPSDQVLVVCEKGRFTLERTTTWDALGFRGTCSSGFVLEATGGFGLVFPTAYGDMSSQTMLPVSHILWSSLWLGMASEADGRARKFVQGAARKTPGQMPPSGMRLAELAVTLQQLHDLVHGARARFAAADADPDLGQTIGYATAMNSLKVSASTLVVEVIQKALLICGMAGYANRSPFTLGRLLRDAYGAQLMVNNDRINANNAQLLLVQRER
ncbi:acyl-CoA dehydrogenase family protein [Luteimicrobium xylanilyticum]|uniref:Acyl-CoA dehydrogenase, short-chain specific n=1 Tax=Luteimicrobium xylanilyticum TaxID=1133546 RepID=A0A5P9QCU8_9MICO|nr:acyl-CoA dehydrogenase family protein [Luteimicrobium xylanilyticum]QFU99274.1 Acyl-CoA dehydrogenase, short-chain specific [Luteimicrobium xylanilyticum]